MGPFRAMVADYMEKDPPCLLKWFPSFHSWDTAEFRNFIRKCTKERQDWKPGPNQISLTKYVLLDDHDGILGHAVLRFPLDDKTSREGGNVAFSSPPSKRGGMNEVYTLNRMLFEAVRAGLARILITSFEEDEVTRRAIEMNRGELDDVIPSLSEPSKNLCRYWIRFR
ncbi:MAG: hypothetical protein AB7G93_06025 [Bdellovibrionales bacterium]